MILFLAILSARLLLISFITLSYLIALPAYPAQPSFIKQQPFQAIFEINNNKTVTSAITQLMKKGAFYYHNKAYDRLGDFALADNDCQESQCLSQQHITCP